MNLHEFRIARDEMQLASMRARKPALELRLSEANKIFRAELDDVNANHNGEWTDSCRALGMDWQRLSRDLLAIDRKIPIVEARLAVNRERIEDL